MGTNVDCRLGWLQPQRAQQLQTGGTQQKQQSVWCEQMGLLGPQRLIRLCRCRHARRRLRRHQLLGRSGCTSEIPQGTAPCTHTQKTTLHRRHHTCVGLYPTHPHHPTHSSFGSWPRSNRLMPDLERSQFVRASTRSAASRWQAAGETCDTRLKNALRSCGKRGSDL